MTNDPVAYTTEVTLVGEVIEELQPADRRRMKADCSSGVVMIRISRMPANMRTDSG